MSHITLITGGARGGKSKYALELAESLGKRRLFVATAEALDDEIKERIGRHREERKGKNWDTIEEPLNLRGVLEAKCQYDVVLVDCLTFWVSNLMNEAQINGERMDEDVIAARCDELAEAAARNGGSVIFVTNEVGMGIVPENDLSRKYRDLLGRLNQVIAGRADNVIMVLSGLPLKLK